jgi:hypothetical protein
LEECVESNSPSISVGVLGQQLDEIHGSSSFLRLSSALVISSIDPPLSIHFLATIDRTESLAIGYHSSRVVPAHRIDSVQCQTVLHTAAKAMLSG